MSDDVVIQNMTACILSFCFSRNRLTVPTIKKKKRGDELGFLFRIIAVKQVNAHRQLTNKENNGNKKRKRKRELLIATCAAGSRG